MGMYTELRFAAKLKEDTPEEVINILRYMVEEGEGLTHPIPDHPLFHTSRWSWMLRSDSYYFSATTHSSFVQDYRSWYLTVQCNLKNYDREIEKFVSWIMPYVADPPGTYLGHSRYEEVDEPTLIYRAEEA